MRSKKETEAVPEGWEDFMDWDDEDDSTTRVEDLESLSVRVENTDHPWQSPLSTEQGYVKATTKQTRITRANKSHNLVEKRYRANLNKKITELRDIIPCLRSDSAIHSEKASAPAEPDPSQKLNKATVLNKAIEYIQELETRNRLLENNIRAMKQYIDTMKHRNILTGDTESATYESRDIEQAQDAMTESTTSIQGMIQVPPEIQKLRRHHLQVNFADLVLPSRPSNGEAISEESELPLGRLHVGSLVL